MPEFKKYGRPNNSRPRPFNNGNSQPRELFDVNCNNCQQRCQVPFRPNGKKPVYCSNCFSKDDSRETSRFSDRGDRGDRRDFKNDFERRPARPPFANEGGARDIQDLKRQVETMNKTLERLASAVESLNRATELTSEVRKHIPEAAPDTEKAAPARKIAKKAVKKVAKKPAKKVAKK